MLDKRYLKVLLLYRTGTNFPHGSNGDCLLLPTLLIPEWESSLLPQCAIHRAAVETLTSIVTGCLHILSGQLKSRKLDALLLSHGHRVSGIFDSQGDAKAGAGIQGRRIDASGQPSPC